MVRRRGRGSDRDPRTRRGSSRRSPRSVDTRVPVRVWPASRHSGDHATASARVRSRTGDHGVSPRRPSRPSAPAAGATARGTRKHVSRAPRHRLHECGCTTRGQARTVQDVPPARATARLGRQVASRTVVHVDDRQERLDDDRQPRVDESEEQSRRTFGPSRPLHGGRIHTDDVQPQLGAELDHASFGQELRSLVRRQERTAMRRILGADHAARLADRRGGRGEHHPFHIGAGSGPDHACGAIDVRAEHGFRVTQAHGVDARHVEHGRASAHAVQQGVLIERDLREREPRRRPGPRSPTPSERARARTSRPSSMSPRRSAPPTKPLPPVRNAGPVTRDYRSRRPMSTPPKRAKYSTADPTVTSAAAIMAYSSG